MRSGKPGGGGGQRVAQCAVKGTSWDKGSDWSQAYPRQVLSLPGCRLPRETEASAGCILEPSALCWTF